MQEQQTRRRKRRFILLCILLMFLLLGGTGYVLGIPSPSTSDIPSTSEDAEASSTDIVNNAFCFISQEELKSEEERTSGKILSIECDGAYYDKKSDTVYNCAIFTDEDMKNSNGYINDRQKIFHTRNGEVKWEVTDNVTGKPLIFKIHNPRFVPKETVLDHKKDKEFKDYIKRHEKFIKITNIDIHKPIESQFDNITEYMKEHARVTTTEYRTIINEGDIPFKQHIKNAGINLDNAVFIDIKKEHS